MKNLFLLILLTTFSAFAAVLQNAVYVANNNLIVVELDCDTASVDSLPDFSGWTVNGGAYTKIGRYSYVRDQGITCDNEGCDTHDSVTHRIYIEMLDSLQEDSSYVIAGPYGTDTLVFNYQSTFNESIKVNQLSYNSRANNLYANYGVFAGDLRAYYLDTNSLPTFSVLDTATNEIVFTGTMTFFGTDTITPDTTYEGEWAGKSGEWVYRMNLDSVPPGGPYVIAIPGFGRSFDFNINYAEDQLILHEKGMYHQRCGIELDKKYTDFTRGKCHSTVAIDIMQTWGSQDWITVDTATERMTPIRGGYHDAGDYDIRPYHTIIPILMLGTYDVFKDNFTDRQFSIPEAGNGVPDFLDEAIWGGLVWEYLQIDSLNFPDSTTLWGAVMQGKETGAHPAYGVDRADYDSREITQWYGTWAASKAITADACGIFAEGARLIRPYDTNRATQLLNRAVLSYNWLLDNDTSTVNSQMVNCALQLYLATVTGDSATDYDNAYHQHFRDEAQTWIVSGGSYPDQFKIGNTGAYIQASHFISYLVNDVTVDSTLWDTLYTNLKNRTDNGDYMGWIPGSHPYAQGVTKFMGLGAGSAQGRYAIGAMYMSKLAPTDSLRQYYFNYATELSNFSVGLNPLGQMFVSGAGDRPVRSPLHLDSYWSKYGTRPNSNYTTTPKGNVPGIVVYGLDYYRSGASYMIEVTDHVYPVWDYRPEDVDARVDSLLPGLRRWTDGQTIVSSNEFSTWETNVWQTILYAALYDDNLPVLDTLHSASHSLLSLESWLTSLADTSTYLKVQASFPGVDTVFLDVIGLTDSLKDTILPNAGQSEFTFNISSLGAGTYFVKTNGNQFGIVTKGF